MDILDVFGRIFGHFLVFRQFKIIFFLYFRIFTKKISGTSVENRLYKLKEIELNEK